MDGEGGVSERMSDTERVFCIRCRRLREQRELHEVFRTGFHRINGVNYPLALCHGPCGFHKMVGGGYPNPRNSGFAATHEGE